MNDALKKYLEKKEELQKRAYEKEKSDLLTREGLNEREYTNLNKWSQEYPYYDGIVGQYYKLIPIEISDEEYQLVKKMCEVNCVENNDVERENQLENKVAEAISVIAWIIYIAGVIAGLLNISEDLIIALICWAGGFVFGTMFLGFAEMIKLLQAIKMKE